jgi:hypothetical protein
MIPEKVKEVLKRQHYALVHSRIITDIYIV